MQLLRYSYLYSKEKVVPFKNDKRRDFPFEVFQYPHSSSTIPKHILKGIIIGQLTRYARLCSSITAFRDNAVLLLKKLIANGHRRQRVLAIAKTFISVCRFPFVNPRRGRLLRQVCHNV